jgi:superfamily II DNA or RNA helicase
MTPTLRPYQHQAVEQIRQAYRLREALGVVL